MATESTVPKINQELQNSGTMELGKLKYFLYNRIEPLNLGTLELAKTNYFLKVAWNSGTLELCNFGTLASQSAGHLEHCKHSYF